MRKFLLVTTFVLFSNYTIADEPEPNIEPYVESHEQMTEEEVKKKIKLLYAPERFVDMVDVEVKKPVIHTLWYDMYNVGCMTTWTYDVRFNNVILPCRNQQNQEVQKPLRTANCTFHEMRGIQIREPEPVWFKKTEGEPGTT